MNPSVPALKVNCTLSLNCCTPVTFALVYGGAALRKRQRFVVAVLCTSANDIDPLPSNESLVMRPDVDADVKFVVLENDGEYPKWPASVLKSSNMIDARAPPAKANIANATRQRIL